MPERVGIPGFKRGRRYIAVDGGTRPEYFTLYETESVRGAGRPGLYQPPQRADAADQSDDRELPQYLPGADARARQPGIRDQGASWRRLDLGAPLAPGRRLRERWRRRHAGARHATPDYRRASMYDRRHGKLSSNGGKQGPQRHPGGARRRPADRGLQSRPCQSRERHGEPPCRCLRCLDSGRRPLSPGIYASQERACLRLARKDLAAFAGDKQEGACILRSAHNTAERAAAPRRTATPWCVFSAVAAVVPAWCCEVAVGSLCIRPNGATIGKAASMRQRCLQPARSCARGTGNCSVTRESPSSLRMTSRSTTKCST